MSGVFTQPTRVRNVSLPVCRYDAASLGTELGEGFTLTDTVADPQLM